MVMKSINIKIEKALLKGFIKLNKSIFLKYKKNISFNKPSGINVIIKNNFVELNDEFFKIILKLNNNKNINFMLENEILISVFEKKENPFEEINASKFIKNYNFIKKNCNKNEEKDPRIRVLLAPDARGWAFDNIAKNIVSRNPYKDKILYDIMYTRDMSSDQIFKKEDKYDYIYVMFEGETRFLSSQKIIRGCYSQFWKENKDFSIQTISSTFSSCAGAIFVNETVRDAIAPNIKGDFKFDIIEDATDPNLFFPINGLKKKDFTAIFVGNTKRKLKNYKKIVKACNEANVKLITCSNIENNKLVNYYNKADVCINFSDHEGGPQTFLETSLCEVPMIIREGNDLSKKIPCFTVSDYEDLVKKLVLLKTNRNKCTEIGKSARIEVLKNFTYSKVSKKFGDFILNMHNSKNKKTKIDLSKEVTVFVISCGENPNYLDCIGSLNNQNSYFKIKYIKNISPMAKAFQKMIDECDTKYYVQVDEDMILEKNAIETLYNSIKLEGNKVSKVCYMLKDHHLSFDIYGIKIYNHSIMRGYPYNQNVISCEKEQILRLEADGFSTVMIDKAVGIHSPKWTDKLIFERYFDLMEKWKIYNYSWMKSIPKKLLKIFKDSPTDQNFYALMGALTSVMSKERLRFREKNFKIEDENLINLKKIMDDK